MCEYYLLQELKILTAKVNTSFIYPWKLNDKWFFFKKQVKADWKEENQTLLYQWHSIQTVFSKATE